MTIRVDIINQEQEGSDKVINVTGYNTDTLQKDPIPVSIKAGEAYTFYAYKGRGFMIEEHFDNS